MMALWWPSPAAAAAERTPPPVKGDTPTRDSQIRILEAAVEAAPDRPGLQLDLAVALCQAGEHEQAQRLLLLLDSRPDLPAGIADVIGWYRRSKLCREDGARAWYAPQGFVATGLGHHQNLNLGPLSDRIQVSGLGQELELAASSRPQAAAGAQFETGMSWELGAAHRALRLWTLSLYGLAQRFEGQPLYALDGLHALLGRKETDSTGVVSETMLGSARLTLGDGTRLAAQTAHSARQWPVGESSSWGGALTLTWIDYAQRAALDARQAEARLKWTTEGVSWRGSGSAGWLEDRQVRDRPGGDRRGPFVVLHASWAHASGLVLEGQWRTALTVDRQPYAQALFGALNRHTLTHTAQTVVRQRLGPMWATRLDVRWARSQDRLPLFSHRAHSAVVWLERSFGQPLE